MFHGIKIAEDRHHDLLPIQQILHRDFDVQGSFPDQISGQAVYAGFCVVIAKEHGCLPALPDPGGTCIMKIIKFFIRIFIGKYARKEPAYGSTAS